MFKEIDEKISQNTRLSIREINICFDKKQKTKTTNKDGEKLYLYRRSDFCHPRGPIGCYSNKAKYIIFNSKGEKLGSVKGEICHYSFGRELELNYENCKEETQGRGNISLALDEVLKQIFLKGDFDNKPCEDCFYSEIKKIKLLISEDNHAAIAVAKKNGFDRINKTEYVLSKEKFLEKLNKEKNEEER